MGAEQEVAPVTQPVNDTPQETGANPAAAATTPSVLHPAAVEDKSTLAFPERTLSGRNYALRDETASRPVYASLSSSVRYLGASAFTFSMNAA